VTVIEIKDRAITVVATDGKHELGGRDWDERVVNYLGAQWQAEHPGSTADPLDSPDTVQELWLKAESAKRTLASLTQTRVPVSHDAQQVAVMLTREKFDELTQDLLEETVSLTKRVLQTAADLGCPKVDRMLLVGGSTKMPQVGARLREEFDFEVKIFEPDQAVAKGAAIYGQKLAIGERIRIELAKRLHSEPEQVDIASAPSEVREAAEETVASEMGLRLGTVQKLGNMVVKNVVSHSFGVLALLSDDTQVISNLILAQRTLPAEASRIYGTRHERMAAVEIKIFENTVRENVVKDLGTGEEIGSAVLELAAELPADSPIEVRFRLDGEGRLHVTGKDKSAGGKAVEATIETNRALSTEQTEEAIKHARGIRVIG
jgi:molecular chaperone DnaK